MSKKNSELKTVSQSTSVSERQRAEAHALLEEEKTVLDSIQKQISFFEGHFPTDFEALCRETAEKRQLLESLLRDIELTTTQLGRVCQEVGVTRVGPVLLKDFDLRIEAAHALLGRLEKITEFLVEKHNRDQVLAVAFLVELKDHLKTCHLLGKLLSHLEMQVSEQQLRLVRASSPSSFSWCCFCFSCSDATFVLRKSSRKSRVRRQPPWCGQMMPI